MMKHLFQSRYPPNAEAKAIISPLKGNSWNDSSVGVDDRESAEAVMTRKSSTEKFTIYCRRDSPALQYRNGLYLLWHRRRNLENRNDDLAKELKAPRLNGATYPHQIASSELRCETLANMIRREENKGV